MIGPTGAGKTTYARRLGDEIGAVRFSVDEWMSALFWMDAPQPIDPSWALERVDRCAAMIWSTAVALARCNTPSVLEIGLTTRARRARYASLAATSCIPCRFHLLDVPREGRWRRVETRNLEPGEDTQLGFAITREMFDYVETMWEAPSAEEHAMHDIVTAAC